MSFLVCGLIGVLSHSLPPSFPSPLNYKDLPGISLLR
jgi:hypothetical protein